MEVLRKRSRDKLLIAKTIFATSEPLCGKFECGFIFNGAFETRISA
jgi:hypothetical protein